MRKAFIPSGVAAAALTLLAGCHTAAPLTATNAPFANGVDSIRVQVAKHVRSIQLMLKGGDNALFSSNAGPYEPLTASEARTLNSQANALFAARSEKIILKEAPAEGRTDYPIFTVTIYRGGTSETTFYDMGTDTDGVTHATNKNITYSPAFNTFRTDIMRYLQQ